METSENKKSKKTADEEISLLDLLAVLLNYKKMIVLITALAMVAVLTYSIVSLVLPAEKSPLPNQYTPKAHMRINGTGMSSLSSLSSLSGLNVAEGAANSSLAVFLGKSNDFLDAVSNKFNFTELYKIKKNPVWSTRKILEKKLICDYDKDSGIFTISFTDIDPVFARDVVNFAVDWMQNRFDELGLDTSNILKKNYEINIESTYKEILRLEKEMQRLGASVSNGITAFDGSSVSMEMGRIQMELNTQKSVYESLRSQEELLKVKMQSEQPVFQIIERPEVPDMKSKPSRGKLCIVVTFAAFFVSVFMAFAINAWENIKNDPEAQKKLNLKSKVRESKN